MAKSGIKSGLRSARKQHIINNNNNNEATIEAEAEVKVKQEPVNEEFKEFAETAMNELLGWYGYGSSAARDSGGGGVEMARPGSYKSNSNSNSSSPVSPLHASGCGWCGKTVDENNGLLSGQSSFCSELCFSQSRRANFKKNKTCDWCRHVRHTISYVDFQEGSAQLQFCSDKCLNQYKMHIFCRETQAHLEFHPHLISNPSGTNMAGGSGTTGLITPDLWLRDCKTPPEEEASMDDDVDDRVREESNRSPIGPTGERRELSPRRSSSVDKVPKLIPIITVAPTSSLLASPSSSSLKRPTIVKKTKNKRKRFSTATITSQSTANTTSLNLDEDVAQDLRVRHNITPPVRILPSLQEIQQQKDTNFRRPSIVFNNVISSSEDANKVSSSPNASDFRVPNPNVNPLDPNKPSASANISMIPPVTVLVPYPIMIPVPLPIPIPLPVSSFLRAYFGSKMSDVQDQQCKNAKVDLDLGFLSSASKLEEQSKKIVDVDGTAGSSSGTVEEEEIIVDVIEDEPKSPRMLRRRKKMLGTSADVKVGSTSKVIKKKI